MQALLRVALGQLLPPWLKALGGARIDRLALLLQDRLAVADDRDADVRAELLISSGSMSLRAILASALKRGGNAWPIT